MVVAFSSGTLWMNIALICVACYIIDQAINVFNFIFLPTIATELQKIVKERGSADNEVDIPNKIAKKLKIYNQYIEEPEVNNKVKMKEKENKVQKIDDNNTNIVTNGNNNNNFNTEKPKNEEPKIEKPNLGNELEEASDNYEDYNPDDTERKSFEKKPVKQSEIWDNNFDKSKSRSKINDF
jgi:hypothetical protein